MYKFTFLIFICSIFLLDVGFAQWPVDSTTSKKICQASGDQKYPEITTDGAGGAIIVWQDGRNASTNIYAQRIDASGVVQWVNNGTRICSSENSQLPKILSDGSGGAFITWFDRRGGSWPNSYVCVQRVNGNGDTLWKANGVILSDSASSYPYPEIISDGSTGAIITWIGSIGQIFAQKINSDGTVAWDSVGVMLAPEGELPKITTDNAGGAIVTWFDYDSQHTYTHVFAQRINSVGTVMWWPKGDTICYAQKYQHKPDILPDGKGGAIISWLDDRADTSSYPFAQRVGSSGLIKWQKDGIQASSMKGYYQVKVASDGAGGAILAWLGGYGNGDLYVQRIDSSGTAQWPENMRISTGMDPTIPTIISDRVTGAFILWEYPSTNMVKVQHITSDGILSFPPDGKMVSVGYGLNGFHSAVTDGSGTLILVWEDMPYYNRDICAHRVTVPNFVTGISNDELYGTVPSEFALDQNYPNPFNPSTMIQYSIPRLSKVKLILYNLLGKEIKTLINEEKAPGSYEIKFNAENIPSGVYFYQLKAGDFTQTKKMILMK